MYLGQPSESRAVWLDNPALSLSDPNVWEAMGNSSYATDAGIRVTHTKALSYGPFWAAVQMIAGDAGSLPLAPYRREIIDGRVVAKESANHWSYSLTRYQASDNETAQDYWETLLTHALVWNNGYGLINFDGSWRPSELLHLLPDRTSAERASDGTEFYATEVDGRLIAIPAWQVLHVKGLSLDGLTAPDFVMQAKATIGAGLAAQGFESKYFRNGCRVGGILEVPSSMPQQAKQTLEEGFRKNYESTDAAFKTVILRENAKFHAAQTTPKDVQIVETQEQKAREIARWFGIPPSKLGISDGSTYNSKSEDGAGYLTHCLRRWLRKIQAQCWLRLLTTSDQRVIEFRHDTDELLRMDLLSRFQAYQIGIQSRIWNPNEVRAKEGLAPYDGGDVFENPNTTSPGSNATDDTEPTSDPPDDVEEDTESPDTPTRSLDTIKRRVLFSLTARARHKAKNPRAFTEWLDARFKDHREEWSTLSGGEIEPLFFGLLHSRLDHVAATVTADALASTVDQIATTFEEQA